MGTDGKTGLTWGKQLRHLRNRLGLTQGQLTVTLANLSFNASAADEGEWRILGIHEEVTDYLGEILDISTLSRLEQGKRALNPRARHIALVWALCRLGALVTVDEANQWLELGEQGHLTETELATLFSRSRGTAEPVDPPIQPTIAVAEPPIATTANFTAGVAPAPSSIQGPPPGYIVLPRWILWAGGALLLGLTLLLLLRLTRPASSPAVVDAPTMVETFDGDRLNRELWQPSADDWHGYVEDGVLHFDLPLNSGTPVEEELNYLGTIEPISRIQWHTVVDTPTGYPSGLLGVQTGCFEDRGWLKVLVGGTPPQLRLAYDPDDEPGGETDALLLPLAHAQPYEITIDWHPYELDIVVNGQALRPVPTACNWTAFFNLSANVEQGQALRGQVDEIGVWYTGVLGE